MTCAQLEGLVGVFQVLIDLWVVQALQYGLGPVAQYVLVIPQEHIVTVQLNNLLEVEHNSVDILIQEGEYLLALLRTEHHGINHAAVPRDNIHPNLFKGAILHLIEDLPADVVLEVQSL
jgi:hypothetical protein